MSTFLHVQWSTDTMGQFTSARAYPADLVPPMADMSLAQWLAAAQPDGFDSSIGELVLALAERRALRCDVTIRCVDGALRRCLLSMIPDIRDDGSWHGYCGSMVDVTEQQLGLKNAVDSEAKHRVIVDNCTDLIAYCGVDGRYIQVSSSYTHLMGWTMDEMLDQPVLEFLHPEDRAQAGQALMKVLEGKPIDLVEVRKRTRDGSYVLLGTKACGVTDPQTGRSMGAVLVSREIGREKEILRQIEAMAEQNQALIENSPDIMFLLDLAGTVLHVNRAIHKVLGYEPSEMLGRTGLDPILVDADQVWSQALTELGLRDGYCSSAFSCYSKDARVVRLEVSMQRPPGSKLIYATARDVTENHRTRLALQKSHEHVRTLLESIDDGFFSVNDQWEITYANTLAANSVGLERDRSVGKVLWDIAPGLFDSQSGQLYRQAMEERQSTSFETFYEPMGVWLSERVFAHEDGLSVYFHDISDRVVTENRIRDSERRLRQMVEITPAGYVRLDEKGIIRAVNPALCELTGYTCDELVGFPVLNILKEQSVGTALDTTQSSVQRQAVEAVIRHKGGHPVYALVNQTVELDEQGRARALTAFITDITERKHAEARLHKLATRDSLTDLPNRAWISQRLDAMLATPLPDLYTTVFFIDLNRFKAVNDAMGHATGDRLLQHVGQRLQACMRPGDAVARLGGDEFVVTASCTGRGNAAAIAERLLGTLQTPFNVDGVALHIGAAIGISLATRPCSTDALFERADKAMYEAKSLKRNGYRFDEQ